MRQFRRRNFLIAAGALLVVARAARAQQSLPVIGYLANASSSGFANYLAAFRRGLGEMGYVEGQNILIEYRWTGGQPDRLSGFAADLVRRGVTLIIATGGSVSALAAKKATSTIPIVFTGGSDPVKLGLVASLGRPGGNATGVQNITTALTAKRLQLLREMAPTAALMALLINPANSDFSDQAREMREAARSIGQQIHFVNASSEGDFDMAFATIVQKRAGALFVSADALFTSQRARLAALAGKHAIPASYPFREFVDAGGLMSYGANLPDVHRQAGVYAGRILKGAKPADLPVEQPAKFELVINMRAAKTLGITIPQSLLTRADEVIR